MMDQLRIAQATDVLVGAHSDGPSHGMSMCEDEGAVVEIQPSGLSATDHQARYENLAAMLGRKYFGHGGSWIADMEQGRGGDRTKAVEIELAWARHGTCHQQRGIHGSGWSGNRGTSSQRPT